MRFAIALTAGAVLASGPVDASAKADKRPPAAAMPLLACRSTADPGQRLACYDHEAQALAGKVAAGNVVLVDKAEVAATQRARFGLAPAGIDAFVGTDGRRPETLDSTVDAARLDQYGKLVITLADHSRWHQIDDYAIARLPRPGQRVVISRAALGSFMLQFRGQAQIRVRRIA